MKTQKFRIIITIIVVIALIGGAAALIMKKKAKLDKAPKYGVSPTLVHVASARKGDLDITLSYLSVAEPFQTANVSSRASASVTAVNVDEGDLVKRGDILAILDAKDISADIEAVSAQIEQARADMAGVSATVTALEKSAGFWKREAKRDTTLAADGAIPEAQAEATVNKADEIYGQLDAAHEKHNAVSHIIRSLLQKKEQLTAQLDYFTLTAPFDGMVSRRLVDTGDLAAPGKPLITVEDRSRLLLAFDVPQQDLDRVHEGLPVEWQYNGEPHSAVLTHIYPSLTGARMVRAEVLIDGNEKSALTIGAYIPVTVRVKTLKDAVIVPADCVVKSQGKTPYVFQVKNGHITVRQITVFGENGKQAAVQGVNPDDALVINTFLGWAVLADGMPVEVSQ